jgi:hypothetical protein
MAKTCKRCLGLEKDPVIINGEKFRVCGKYSFEIHPELITQTPGICQE